MEILLKTVTWVLEVIVFKRLEWIAGKGITKTLEPFATDILSDKFKKF